MGAWKNPLSRSARARETIPREPYNPSELRDVEDAVSKLVQSVAGSAGRLQELEIVKDADDGSCALRETSLQLRSDKLRQA
jgi:hypothetical protein